MEKFRKEDVKIIVVTGGVLSGLGKGVVCSSIINLIKYQGYNATGIKIDPYLNVDAGTMRPTEHGEVFVTDDGGETDQDLGNYERFGDIKLSKKNSITTGQVFLSVLNRERNLEYDGKCVEVIPHIPQEIEERIFKSIFDNNCEFGIIEVGGTVGDYQNILFLEALKEIKRKYNNVVFTHVGYLPILTGGEMKSKPLQHSIRMLNSVGIQPDIIIGRSENEIDDVRREKIATLCCVKEENIISAPNVDNIYKVPLIFDKQLFMHQIFQKFNLIYDSTKNLEWKKFIERIGKIEKKIKIGMIGKYFDIGSYFLSDSYISVIEAIKHAGYNNNVHIELTWLNSKEYELNKEKINELSKYDAIIIPGGYGSSGVEGIISSIKFIRENNIPLLGLCYGFQLMCIEFARNKCNLQNAHSTEIDNETEDPIIDLQKDQKENLLNKNMGGTNRLGAYFAKLKKDSQVYSLYHEEVISERHRHRYEVNSQYIKILESNGLCFSGKSPDGNLMEFLEYADNNYFIGTQAHPEFKSRPLKPSPLFDGLIKAALKRKSTLN
ncbi:CTP synthase [Candidatus Woesearchaeota archaeon]|jgi:CTP synthase|nr:CTP synthase [Candidatus Woesearchaeota archaeon]MBT4387125.1 CTP synthase [Candidatus Woesearchaeota archaeon]MBT4596118.1 CTP synthase [Candidatus Woesearchaeota archaeon]MBT5741659.1 CTP synthase [Candidatus Woesearchaeota archaeon]MBT6505680.1 CTP synthase [Candidatus Woesearchaeota archaeon]